MSEVLVNDVEEAYRQFNFKGELVGYKKITAGHINDTMNILFKDEDGYHRYILQRVNNYVYKKPDEVMINMDRITSHIAKKILARGGNPEKEVLSLIHTHDDKPYYIDSHGETWRVMRFIDGEAYNGTPSAELFKQGGIAFGRFQHDLADFPVSELYETIIDFHNTPARYKAFEKVLAEDKLGRAKEVTDLIDLVKKYSYLAYVYDPYIKDGTLPLRATHNDTKLNNVMLDKVTGAPICVLDLDTCMPGYSVNDFGDAIRSGTITSKSETDPEKIHVKMELYRSYCEGFLGETHDILTESEKKLLPISSQVMTFELGMRYLTDFLEGDPYFRPSYPAQNKDKARNQLYFLLDMIKHQKEMEDIVTDVLAKLD